MTTPEPQPETGVPEPSEPPDTSVRIVVYWRPRCGYCGSLRRQLDHHGVEHDLVNIWEDPDGAAFVRSVARGNETVPTVSVGSEALVNPNFHALMAVAAELAPSLVPQGYEPPEPRTGWISRHFNR